MGVAHVQPLHLSQTSAWLQLMSASLQEHEQACMHSYDMESDLHLPAQSAAMALGKALVSTCQSCQLISASTAVNWVLLGHL